MNYNRNLYSKERAEFLRKLEERRKKRTAVGIGVFVAILIVCLAIVCVCVFNNSEDVDSGDVPVATDDAVVPAIADNVANPYENIYYYEAENYDRYVSYAEAHPELSVDDVVWQVNSYLDYEFYTHDVEADVSSPYVIVNKYYKVADDYVPDNLVYADGHQMTEETAAAYYKMKADAASQGLYISVVSGFRTVEYQRNLYNSYLATDSKANVDRYSARPGYSEHHTGMAIDLVGSFGSLRDFINTPESPWIYENAHKYGFIVRYWTDIEQYTGYEDEPWHLRYLGVDVATDMYNRGITCFEEYKVKFIEH